jgi:hypothetical protein
VVFICFRCPWNIAIQESSATQASLLTNLFRFGRNYFRFFFKTKPATNFDWQLIALFGMAMLSPIFIELNFDRVFILAVVTGFYIPYLLPLKAETDVLSFMTISLIMSAIYLGGINGLLLGRELFWFFTDLGY